MLRARTAVLVSGGGTNLQALIDAERTGSINSAEISLVISSKENVYALERAKNSGIPAIAIPKKQCATQAEFEQKIQAALQEHKVDIIVLAGFLSILSADFTEKWQNRIINVHPSLIPAFCGEGYYGLRVHEAALKRGVKLTGATIHYVNHIPDGGEIILQKSVQVRKGDTAETLQKRVMEQAEWKILPKALEQVARRVLKENKNYGN